LGLGLVITLLLVGYIALLSSLETALLSARRSRLSQIKHPRAPAAEALIEDPEQFQSSAHLAKSLTESLVYPVAALTGMQAALSAGPVPHPLNIGSVLARTWPGVVSAALLAYFAVTVLGEALPKALSSRNPEQVLLRGTGFIRAFTVAFTPIFWVTCRVARFLATRIGIDPSLSSRAAHSEEEIKLLVEDSAEEGVLEEEEKEMIHSIFEFADTFARQIMVPRIDVCSVSMDAPLTEVVEAAMASGHSRLPIHDGTVDKIVGVVHVKDLLPHLVRGEAEHPVREVMRPPYFVPEAKKIDELLQEFRRYKSQMAIVVDEFGGTSGLVTVEDVLEEIVGEIEDEYDTAARPGVEATTEGEGTLVDARVTIEDVNDELGLALPTEETETLGGFVFSLFGRPPAVGERVRYGNIEFQVEAIDGVRLNRIRISPVPEEPLPSVD
jgi:CBS domain containing-hemolysin-like protein